MLTYKCIVIINIMTLYLYHKHFTNYQWDYCNRIFLYIKCMYLHIIYKTNYFFENVRLPLSLVPSCTQRWCSWDTANKRNMPTDTYIATTTTRHVINNNANVVLLHMRSQQFVELGEVLGADLLNIECYVFHSTEYFQSHFIRVLSSAGCHKLYIVTA